MAPRTCRTNTVVSDLKRTAEAVDFMRASAEEILGVDHVRLVVVENSTDPKAPKKVSVTAEWAEADAPGTDPTEVKPEEEQREPRPDQPAPE